MHNLQSLVNLYYNKRKKEIISGDIPKLNQNWHEFNQLIGLPKHPYTLEPTPMMPWQNQYVETISLAKEKRKGVPLKVHANKSRQIGFTDEKQRFLAFHGFNWYAGKKVINMAGTREKTTKKIMYRLRELFNNIENQIADNGTDLYFKLKNGTEYEGVPFTAGSIRGDTKIGAIAIDEAAHSGMIDDSPILDSVIPIIDTNRADLFMYSTPNGPHGFFWDIETNNNDYIKLKYSIYVTLGYLHTQEDIDRILAQKDVDVEQEYLNQYTTSRNAVFTNLNIDDTIESESW